MFKIIIHIIKTVLRQEFSLYNRINRIFTVTLHEIKSRVSVMHVKFRKHYKVQRELLVTEGQSEIWRFNIKCLYKFIEKHVCNFHKFISAIF